MANPTTGPREDEPLDQLLRPDGADRPLTRLPGFPLVPADLAGRSWRFGRTDAQSPYASHMRLLADGTFGGHRVETEWNWQVQDGVVVFLDRKGRRSTVLDQVFADDDGRLVLRGRFVLVPDVDVVHELHEIDPPGRLRPAGDLDILRRSRAAPRRNLVVLGANETSLHVKWARDIPESDRSWDLYISFYGQPESFGKDDWAEYQSRQFGKGKWAGASHLCQEGGPVWDYDYIAFPDDDLMMSWSDINELFVICRQFQLDLAQPALRAGPIPISHAITAQDPQCLLRFVSFVESMMPIFSRRALAACAETFGLSVSGFGLDNIWPKLIGEPTDRMAVIDRVSILHTRPMAVNYDLAAAVAEGNELQRRYNATSRVQEWGRIHAHPIDAS